MTKLSKKIMPILGALLLAIGLLTLQSYSTPNANTSISSTDTDSNSDSGGSGGIFDAEHPITVQCKDTRFTRTDYCNSAGTIVGTTLIEAGIVKLQYTGSYTTTITTSGGVAAHSATAIQCYGWGLGCTPITAAQACS